MSSCDRAQNLFGRAWDDELTVSERDGLEVHLKDCNACRREYDELARTLELVQALPRPAVADDFATRVLAEATRREAAGETPRRILAFPSFAFEMPAFGRPAYAIAATFVVALGVTAFLLRGPANTTNPGAPQMATVTEQPQAQHQAPAPIEAAPTEVARTEVARTEVAPDSRPTAAQAVPAPVRRERESVPATTIGLLSDGPVIPDSLFDHTADVELVLDPVPLRRERGRGYQPTTVRGQAASITF